VALRFTGGGILLLLVLQFLEPDGKLRRKDLIPMAALGCFGVATAQTGFTFGETLGVNKIVGGAVILLGVYLARRQ
jgi:drug/metabolite transporter (DMT)-like permease